MIEIHPTAVVGEGFVAWEGTLIREFVKIGDQCSFGRNVYVGPGVCIGDLVRVQNGAQIHEDCTIENGVFVGPNALITNDELPRAVNPDLSRRAHGTWQKSKTTINCGASIGAGALVVGSVEIGEWALVGAGAVVVKDVPAYSLQLGVPARHVGWVDKRGERLRPLGGKRYFSESTSEMFQLEDGDLVNLGSGRPDK